MRFEGSALGSRFGLRILIVFMVSAVVPILVLAVLAYMSTRDQLEQEALAALQRDAKAATMSILERINIGAAQLELASIHEDPASDAGVRAFERIERVRISELDLLAGQRAHLRDGRFLLSSGGSEQSGMKLLLARDDEVWIGHFASRFLYTPERITEGERYWIVDDDGGFLFGAASDGSTRRMVGQVGPVDDRVAFEMQGPGGPELAMVWPLFLRHPFLSPQIRVGIAKSKQSILRPLADFRANFIATLVLAILGSAVIALHQIRIRVGPLAEISRVTHEIEQGDFSSRSAISSGDEFEVLGRSINAMAEKLGTDFGTLETLRLVAEILLDVSDWKGTADVVIPAGIQFSGANRGSLFVLDRTADRAQPRLVEVSRGVARASGDAGVPSRPIDHAQRAFESAETTLLYREDGRDTTFWSEIDAYAGAPIEAVYLVPLVSGSGDPEGVLELLFLRQPADLGVSGVRRSLRILAAQAGAALRKLAMIEEFRGLFEGVIRLTVDAIDEKSPYTGDHCRRVPVVTELLADAVCDDREGAFKDFTMSESERYELKIAALLHDCGKVATPVHVMDKATKLETIIDRIQLVRSRTEIIRRDLELMVLRERLASNGLDPTAGDQMDAELSQLESDLRFVERCNIGGEFMEPSHQDRIDEILTRYGWMDRSGRERSLITEDEAMNLKISRGTLNAHEREVINNHVVTTIRLLDQLPFPPEMENVPAIAGAHHEHIDGTGYPKGLAHDQLSIQCRLLGLADVFEALTAKTRPYKPGKSLSETLEILERMVEQGELDRDLHEVFVRKKVYLQYAVEHMDPQQVDEAHREDFERMTAEWGV